MAEPSRIRRHLRHLWRNWVKPIAIVAAILFPLRSSVADWNDVPSGSMNPTIFEGDRIFVNKLAYDLKLPFTNWTLVKWSQPRRGDIVTFWSPESGIRLVKRVIAVPGDRVEMRAGRLLINGEPAAYTDPPGGASSRVELRDEVVDGDVRRIQLTPARPVMRTFAPITVRPGEFWVMGDNRDNSRDSRFFGPVSEQLIAGRAVAVAFSLDRDHGYTPRWGRTLLGLD